MRRRAFTLIELVMVVIIIGIISTLSYVSFTNSLLKAQEMNACIQLINLHRVNTLQLRKTGQYIAGNGLNLNQINAAFSLNMPSMGMIYSYTRTTPNTFVATARYNRFGSHVFTVAIDERTIAGFSLVDGTGSLVDPLLGVAPAEAMAAACTANPYCFAGNCPTLSDC